MKENQFKQFNFNLIDKIFCGPYDRPVEHQKIIDYIMNQDKFSPLTKEQWRKLFGTCKISVALAKWLIDEHYDLEEEAIGLVAEICNQKETSVESMEDIKKLISYIYERVQEEKRGEILGTAFVLTCKNNNLYLIKWLLEQGADVEYCYDGQNGLEAARANIKSYDGIEDKNIVNYLQNNIHKSGGFDEVKKYYRMGFYEPPKAEVNTLLLETARERADSLLQDLCPNLLKEETSSEELHLFMEDYNWDDGIEIPYFVMLHPNCELATALMIF